MAKFCSHCGAPLQEGNTFCAKCGAKIEADGLAAPPAADALAPIPQSTEQTAPAPQAPAPQGINPYMLENAAEKISFPLMVVLNFGLGGLAWLYYVYTLTNNAHFLAGERRFASGGFAVLFHIITLGIYGIYWWYKIAESLNIALEKRGLNQYVHSPGNCLARLFLGIICFFFGGIVGEVIMGIGASGNSISGAVFGFFLILVGIACGVILLWTPPYWWVKANNACVQKDLFGASQGPK